MTRTEFRNGVFQRDNGICVFCDKPAVDAHHIMERRLWNDGGYHLDNGASVCETHHLLCETTEISVEEVRQACKIKKPVLPEHMYSDEVYDKWGNIVLANGQRIPGELFEDESVQKVLKQGGVLGRFTYHVKYPRTYHLPWSENMNEDDRMLTDLSNLVGHDVIVTVKMDGENTSMYTDYIHARSLDGRSHPSRDWVKNFWNGIRHEIPEGWRVCGENLYAKHSIAYGDLSSYFLGFSVWDQKNECISWDETIEWFNLLNIASVPVIYRGVFDENKIRSLWNNYSPETTEGYVVRRADPIYYKDFRKKVGKFVRKNHIQTVKHNWQTQQVVKNSLMLKGTVLV